MLKYFLLFFFSLHARTIGNFTGYRCKPYGKKTYKPIYHSKLNLKFKRLIIENEKMKIYATFDQEDSHCTYIGSLLILKDTTFLQRSQVYRREGSSLCEFGKEVLDKNFKKAPLVYWNKNQILLMIDEMSAEALCDQKRIGVDFNYVLK